jgi:hypothetical protein
MVRDACRHRQSGPDRLENQPTAPAALGGKACYFGDRALVYRLAYNDDIVAFKMRRRSGLGRTGPSRTAGRRAHLAPFLHWERDIKAAGM